MNINNFTTKSQEALNSAQNIAARYSQQAIDCPHLLWALASQEDGLIPELLANIGIQAQSLAQAAENEISKMPAVHSSSQADTIYVGSDLNRALAEAEAAKEHMQDSYISVEHLLLGMLEVPGSAEKLFKTNGIMDTTVNAIVREVDVAKGLFYYYFKSKDDVIEAIARQYSKAFEKTIGRSLNRDDYDERLHQFTENVIVSFRELWGNLRGENENIDLSILSNRTLDETKAIAADVLKKLLDEGIAAGKLQITNSRYYADIIIGGIADLIRQNQADPDEIKKIINDMIDMMRKESK